MSKMCRQCTEAPKGGKIMNIDSIKNGIVIDHITAGKGMEIYRLLELDATDYSVALIKNASSSKMGKRIL